MKTDQLVSLLATGATPVRRGATTRRLGLALAFAVPVALALMLTLWGVRSDLTLAMLWPMFWVKQLFPAVFAVAAWLAVHRLARPGARVRGAWLGLALPVVALWALGLAAWFGAPEGARAPLLWGQTWRTCGISILALSLPAFVAAFWALKGLAPTRPALAGAAAGALAAGVGATVYAVHCPELTAPFLAVWYVLGMTLPVLAGAALGPRLLRW